MIRKIIITCSIIFIITILIFFGTRRVNVVLIGTDNVEKNSYRADTIIFLTYKPFTKKLSVLSIPRDTIVDFNQRTKINSIYMNGFLKGGVDEGSKFILKSVSDLLGIKIPFYVHINYEGFVRAIDSIGGIKIKVSNRMKYQDRAGKLDIDIMPGVHNLNGKKSLEYIRYRTHESADIGRIARQHEFIKALIKKSTKEYNIKNLSETIKILFKYVDTNLVINDVIVFANKIKNLGYVKIDTLPGESIYIKGVSYWYPDYQKIQVWVKEMLD